MYLKNLLYSYLNFYYLLLKRTKEKSVSIDINKFSKLLNAEHYMNDINGLNRRVFQQSVKNIKEITNEDIELKFVRKGRKYSEVIIS